MEYNFTDEILDIIKHKTSDLFDKLYELDQVLDPDLKKESDPDLKQESESDPDLKKEFDPDLKKGSDPDLKKESISDPDLKKESVSDPDLKQVSDPDLKQVSESDPDLKKESEFDPDNKKNVDKDTLTNNFLEKFKLFHYDTRINTILLKYIIHKKIQKIKESDNLILFKELNKFKNNKEITELIWNYIHSVYLLYEYALLEPNKEILTALIQKIKIETEGDNNNLLTSINDNNYEEGEEEGEDVEGKVEEGDMFDKIKEKKEFKIFNDVFTSFTKNMDIDPSTANTNFINEIMDDIKTNINNSDGVDDLFNSTKNIGEKYKNMYNDGKISLNDLMSSMMNIMSNPKNISNTIKNINVQKIPDMNSIMNKLVTEAKSSDDLKNMMNSDDVKNMMNSDIVKNMKNSEMLKDINFDPNDKDFNAIEMLQKKDFNPMDMLKNMNLDPNNKDFNPMDMLKNMNFDPNKKDFNPMDIISNMMNGSSNNNNDEPLTNEQLSEMENFYSNLNIGDETNE